EAVRGPAGWIWEFIYPAGLPPMPGISVLYVLVPWIGVMAAGYGFRAILIREASARRRLCLRIGLLATALFLVAGSLGVLLIRADDGAPNGLFRLLNQQK